MGGLDVCRYVPVNIKYVPSNSEVPIPVGHEIVDLFVSGMQGETVIKCTILINAAPCTQDPPIPQLEKLYRAVTGLGGFGLLVTVEDERYDAWLLNQAGKYEKITG